MAWAICSLGHRRREEFPVNFFRENYMKELSVFIDESGDFGVLNEKPAYYLVSMVFHDQDSDISREIVHLEQSLSLSEIGVEYIHTGPIIRRESIFKELSLDERRQLIYRMLNFYNKTEWCVCLAAKKEKRKNS